MKLNAAGTPLAAFSYTLYLSHFPLIMLLGYYGLKRTGPWNATTYGWFLLVVAISVLAGWLLYLPFERRTGDARRWLSARLKTGRSGS